MVFRADLYTSAGRLQYTANEPDELKRMIGKCEAEVMGWRIVDVTSQKTVDYWSMFMEQLTDNIDRCMLQQSERGM